MSYLSITMAKEQTPEEYLLKGAPEHVKELHRKHRELKRKKDRSEWKSKRDARDRGDFL